MRPFILGLSALLLAAALPARACINDREVNRSEREFKSQYQRYPASPQPAAGPSPQGQSLSAVFLGGGAVLLLGATLTVLNLRQRPAPR